MTLTEKQKTQLTIAGVAVGIVLLLSVICAISMRMNRGY